jgi:hypothetical protein
VGIGLDVELVTELGVGLGSSDGDAEGDGLAECVWVSVGVGVGVTVLVGVTVVVGVTVAVGEAVPPGEKVGDPDGEPPPEQAATDTETRVAATPPAAASRALRPITVRTVLSVMRPPPAAGGWRPAEGRSPKALAAIKGIAHAVHRRAMASSPLKY